MASPATLRSTGSPRPRSQRRTLIGAGAASPALLPNADQDTAVTIEAIEVRNLVLLSNLGRFACVECAADAMGLSSAHARRSLHDIETSAGLRLLERRHGRLSISAAGAVLLEQARRRLDVLRTSNVNRATSLLPSCAACRCDPIAEALRCVYGFPED